MGAFGRRVFCFVLRRDLAPLARDVKQAAKRSALAVHDGRNRRRSVVVNDPFLALEFEDQPKANDLPERPTSEQLEARYVEAVNLLFADARKHGSYRILVDVLAWSLARLIVGCAGTWGAGDIMRLLGTYVCKLIERDHAQEEAKRARDEGQRPH